MTDLPDTMPIPGFRRPRPSPPPMGSASACAAGAILSLLVLAGSVGCSHGSKPRPLSEEVRRAAEVEGPDQPQPAETTQQEETPEGADSKSEKSKPSTLVVIDRGDDRGRTSLWEAARAERERRETARPSVASVTNENLHEYQDAELTFAEAREDQAAAADATEKPPEAGDRDLAGDGTVEEDGQAEDAEERGEEYWRSRMRALRLELRTTADEIDELEQETASLRRSFYAEDDPYVRDARIKPAWDRARDRLTVARRELGRLRDELDETLTEGRRAGALPGWLREGIELEPSFEGDGPAASDDGGLRIHEPDEPETVDPDEPPRSDR